RFSRIRVGFHIGELIGGNIHEIWVTEVITHALIRGLPSVGCVINVVGRTRSRVACPQGFGNLELLNHGCPRQGWCGWNELILAEWATDRMCFFVCIVRLCL